MTEIYQSMHLCQKKERHEGEKNIPN